MASEKGHIQVCELLLDRGAEVNHKNDVCDTYNLKYDRYYIYDNNYYILYYSLDGQH
jgi:hypothetical protein